MEQIVRRNWAAITAHLVPGATVVDRSFFDGGPANDGTVVLDAGPAGTRRTTPIELPGLRLVTRIGAGPVTGDVPFTHGLHFSGQTRAYLDNLKPSRARGSVRRTLTRAELEERLARMMTASGPDAVQRLRDEARKLAPVLDAEEQARTLDSIIGTLFGTRDAPLRSSAAKAMRDGRAFDDRRIDLFAALQQALFAEAPVAPRLPRERDDARIFAFYEAYFSNSIEGTRFTVEQAAEIVFDGVVPDQRPDDAHDVQGTYALIYPPTPAHARREAPTNCCRCWRAPPGAAGRARRRQPWVLQDAEQPGRRDDVRGLDARGGHLPRRHAVLPRPARGLARAIFVMFFIAEVHPFADGNGRVARVFMNAELSATGQQRIIIPTGFRQNYLSALTGLSRNDHATGLIRALDFAHRYSVQIDWESRPTAQRSLDATGAFEENAAIARIRLPEPWD